jgi:hypothetical protein
MRSDRGWRPGVITGSHKSLGAGVSGDCLTVNRTFGVAGTAVGTGVNGNCLTLNRTFGVAGSAAEPHPAHGNELLWTHSDDTSAVAWQLLCGSHRIVLD